MWTRKQLKQKGKMAFKRNYWKTVLIAVIMLLLTGGITSGSSYSFDANDLEKFTNRDSISSTIENSIDQEIGMDGDYDVDPGFSNHVGDNISRMVMFATIGIVILVIALIVAAIAILFDIFLINPLLLGANRFFIHNLNAKAQVGEIGFSFDSNYKNIVKVMFFKDLYVFLWSLLFIIPGIVKSYEYRMIPYILAENPHISKEEAFAMTKNMMSGQKWRAFVLDLSFIGWHILSIFTVGILEIFYVAPYAYMTNAALYEALKNGGVLPEYEQPVYANPVQPDGQNY